MQERPLIFLSYARKNVKIVNSIETLLQEIEFQPWVDRQKLIGGQQWADEIQHIIDRCQLLVLVLTPAALKSEYVRREYLAALKQGKPILLLRCQPTGALPSELAHAPSIDFHGNRDQSRYDLLDAIDLLGIQRPVAASGFDGYLAVARAYHRRMPSTWHSYATPRAAYARLLPLEVLQLLVASVLAYLAFTRLDHFNFLLSYVGPLFTGIAAVYLSRSYRLFLLAIGYQLPEILVVTPEGFALRNVRFHSFQQFRVPRFPFVAVRALTVQQRFTGEYTLAVATTSAVLKQATVVMRRRMGDGKIISAQVLAAFQQHQQLAHAVPVPSASTNSTSVAPSAAPMVAPSVASPMVATPVAPHIVSVAVDAAAVFISATRSDHAFVERLQKGLANRHLQLFTAEQFAGDVARLNTAITASHFMLVVISHASHASGAIQEQYRAALSQGKTVIPLLAQPHSSLPAELQNLQWIDCSNKARWDFTIADLLIALAAAGMALPPGMFDGELALARAMRGQLAVDSTGFRVAEGSYGRLFRSTINNAIYSGFIMLLISLFALAVFAGTLVQIFADHDYSFLPGPLLALGVTVGVWALPIFYIRRARLLSRLQRQKVMPELLAITPAGVATHFASRRYIKLQTKSYPFADAADVVLYRLLGSVTALGIKNKATGKIAKIRIARGFLDVNTVATAVIAAFQKSRR